MIQENLFRCQIQSKNSNKEKNLELNPYKLKIWKKEKIQEEQYKVIHLDELQTRVEWILKDSKLQGFHLFYFSRKQQQNKRKTYFSNLENLRKFKKILDGKVIYQNFQNHYELLKLLQSNKKTQVFECLDKLSQKIRVAKKIKITEYDLFEKLDYKVENFLEEEIKILMKINLKPHKYLLKVDEFFIENGYLIYIMNKCNGGTLYQYICNRNFTLDFDNATKITKKILKGVQHLNTLGIIHRDLKLDNIMFQEENKLNTLKIIDFEYSIFYPQKNQLICGTLGYIAPEILNGKEYNYNSDVYSVGCIYHALMTGKKIFPLETNKQALLSLNKQNRFKLSSKVFQSKAYEIMLKMLKNVNERPTATECLKDEIFLDKFQKNDRITYQIKKLEFPQLKNPFQTQLTQSA